MSKPRLFLCSDVAVAKDDPLRRDRHVVALSTAGPDANVNIRLFDLAKVFLRHLSPRVEDALEIAAYVYAADGATSRGGRWTADAIEPWSRDLRFVIPVRDLPFWERDEVRQLLVQGNRITFSERNS
jgi:hypothetical protein